MLYSIIRNGFTYEAVIQVLSSVFIVFCIVPIHEFAHALIANSLGDQTARLSGRLTISPLAHIDWRGAILLFLFGFGWGKPVLVNMRNLKIKNKKLGMALVAVAGPVSNLLMALIFSFIYVFVYSKYYSQPDNNTLFGISIFFNYAAQINVYLAVFNLLPVPPLDGSRILNVVLPVKMYYSIMRYERYIALGIMVLIFTGILSRPLSYISGFIFNAFLNLARLPFGI